MLSSLLDRWLYRHPFEGRSARRYAENERPAFGDLDDRLLDVMLESASIPDADSGSPRRLLDLGCGPGTFAARAHVRYPQLTVIALDPSRDFAAQPHPGVTVIRAGGESLPLADASIDVAICLSSIRHVQDRARTFTELRRVTRRAVHQGRGNPSGHENRGRTDDNGCNDNRDRGDDKVTPNDDDARVFIVELDPTASATRIAAHADRLGSPLLRHAFGPLVVRTAPPVEVIESLATAAGFTRRSLRADPIQPVYILELV